MTPKRQRVMGDDETLDWLALNDPDFSDLTPREYLKRHGILTPPVERDIAIREVTVGSVEYDNDLTGEAA